MYGDTVLAGTASCTPELLEQHLRENPANCKVHRNISVADKLLPECSTDKILRNELKARVGDAL